MPIAPGTMFMNLKGLAVRYRASAEPSQLEIGVTYKRKDVSSIARVGMRNLVDAINHGAAGGADFAPASSSAKLIKGTFDPKKPGLAGPGFSWTLEVTGIAPQFLRVMIDAMATSGGIGTDIERFLISGSLPPKGDALSVDDRTMLAWLEDFDAYPKAWPKLPFAVERKSVPRGAMVKVGLQREASPAIVDKLEEVFSHWGLTKTTMPNAARKKGLPGMADLQPKLARKKHEVNAKWNVFDHHPIPTFDMLTNMLIRFHETVSPIVSVEIAHP